MLPAGDDPDTFIRKQGRRRVPGRLRESRPYLEYLLDRAAAGLRFRPRRRPPGVSGQDAARSRPGFPMPPRATSLRTGSRTRRALRKRSSGRKSGRPRSSGRPPWRRSPPRAEPRPSQTGRKRPDLGPDARTGHGRLRPARDRPGRSGRPGNHRDHPAGPIPAGMARGDVTAGPDRAAGQPVQIGLVELEQGLRAAPGSCIRAQIRPRSATLTCPMAGTRRWTSSTLVWRWTAAFRISARTTSSVIRALWDSLSANWSRCGRIRNPRRHRQHLAQKRPPALVR